MIRRGIVIAHGIEVIDRACPFVADVAMIGHSLGAVHAYDAKGDRESS